METKLFVNPHADPSIPSPRSEAVANELRGLSLQPPRHLLPIRERQNVLQLKLQQRRTREELVSQGIMPPLKSSASFHEQRRSLERARTEDYLKRKIRSRPEKSELIRMHILEETLAEPLLQAKQLQLKRARLADDLNDKIAHRPGPMELIHKNILPIHSSIKQAIIETQFPKASGENSSCDEDSNDSLSPGQPVSRECPLGPGTLPSPAETLAGGSLPSPTQVPPAAPPLAPVSGSSITLKLTNGTVAASVQRTGANSHIKPKPKSDQSTQRHKKTKDNKPKIKKLKYHQYIPPDQKGDKEPPPHLDSSYAKILHQQQLFLQLQILSQQQQHYNYHAILPAPPKTQTDQQPPSSSSSSSTSTSSPPRPAAAAPAAAPSTLPSNQRSHSSAPLNGTKPASLPPNLDEMKVAELKSELKLRSLPVSGTKNDLIERLRTYQELNGGGDTTSSPTAGGTTGPGAEGAGRASETAANNNTSQQQQQFHCHQTSSLNADAGSSATLNAATQQQQHLLTCGGSLALSPVSLTPCDHSPAAMSSEDSSFSSDPLGELMSSPLTQLSLQPSSAAQLPSNIKEETSCSTPAPCQFSLKSASLQKLGAVSPAAPTSTTTAPAVIIDKDRMLQEKDKQIEELMRMLRQKQQLVEVLRMQLEHGNREGQGPQPQVLLRVKEEPPDKPSVALSTGRPLLPPQASHEMDVTMVTIKQEAIEEGEVVPVQSQDTNALLQPVTQTQESQEQIQLHPEQKNAQNKPEYVCLQQTALQLAQQQAMQKLLLQQQHNMQKQQQKLQNHNQMLENQQKLCQQRKKKCQKLQLQQQQQQKQAVHSQQHQQLKHLQQMQLKQQILLKQQKSLLQQQLKQQQQTKQLQQIQIETKIQLKQQQQQVLVQQKQQMQRQQPPQVPQAYLNQQSGSAPSFSLDLLKSDSTPTLVTDSNGNHFLIALTSQVAGNQKTDACEGKAGNHIMLQRLQSTPAKLPGHNPVQLTRADNEAKQSTHVGPLKQQSTKIHNGAVHVSMEKPQQGAAHSLSAPPSLQPFFKDQEAVSSGKNTSSPFSQTEVCPSLDVFFSPQSPASIKTPASSPDDKDSEHEDDFIDTILQTGDMSSTFTPTPDPSLDHLSPDFSASSPPPSPLHLLLSPPVPPSCDSPRPASSGQPQLPTNTTEEKQLLFEAGGGRLEDFLESTTGKPLLGVEPGGLLTLIDDLHSQMLCTPSILDHPPSPMDTFSVAAEREQGLDSMDWLDFTSGGEKDEETPTLAPLAPQTPPCVFSTDFLDSYDLHIHLDSCL